MVRNSPTRDFSCPFIERSDHRCASRFTLARLNEAFGVCVNGGYHNCPNYREMVREQQTRHASYLTIDITIRGRHASHRIAV